MNEVEQLRRELEAQKQAGAVQLRELTAMRGAMTERNTLAERTTDALLQRVQALEADKRSLEPRFDSLVLRCNRCKRLFYACMIRALRDADTFKDISAMITAGATVELLEERQELKRSEFGCKCNPAEYAALSQSVDTTRNV